MLPRVLELPQVTRPRLPVSKSWPYKDLAGRLLGYAVRFEAEDGIPDNQLQMVTFWQHPDGRREWRVGAFPTPRPLYGLERLAQFPNAPVLVVEGEEAADAAQDIFPDHVVITSSGGSYGASPADWLPLVSREITIWRDASQAGLAYERDVADILVNIGAASVRAVDVPGYFTVGWSLADECPPGVTSTHLRELLVAASEAIGWSTPRPIKISLPQVEPLLPEMLPEAVRAYVFDVAHRLQVSPDYVAVTAICSLAAALGNGVRLAPKQNDDWQVVPESWGMIIGRPSASKTPAMKAALAPLNKLETERRDRWHAECQRAKVDEKFAELSAKELRKNASKAIRDGNEEEARKLLSSPPAAQADSSAIPRLVVNDATVEKLGELLSENPGGLLLVRDELFGLLSRLSNEEFSGERAFYLEAYNGDGSYTYDRIGRGTIHIPSCTLSIVGGIQPLRVAPLVNEAVTGGGGDGLLQRFQLVVWPDENKEWAWVDEHPCRQAGELYEQVTCDLHQLGGSSPTPVIFRFSPAAQELFKQWMEEVNQEARSGGLSPALESHLLKMPKTVASLALIFELVDGGRFEVGEPALRQALAWADYLRGHANRLYACRIASVENAARLIVERRAQLVQEFTMREVHQKGWAGLTDREVVQASIELLRETGHCRRIPSSRDDAGGRPTERFQRHPSLRPR